MPEPDDGSERELGPRISEVLHAKAGASGTPSAEALVREARRRIRKRRQTLMAAAATVLVAVSIGGVWNAVGGSMAEDSTAGSADQGRPAAGSAPDPANDPAPDPATGSGGEAAPGPCPPQHAISKTAGEYAVPPGIGLDLTRPVLGLQACRYRVLTRGQSGRTLLGAADLGAEVARQVVRAIAGLPERNPDLPVFKCAPEVARPAEAIVLRFSTAAGVREVWVGYDGCASAGFFTGNRAYGLYAAPLRLFLVGSVRPAGGTYLSRLSGW
jgi:hypothetical protein